MTKIKNTIKSCNNFSKIFIIIFCFLTINFIAISKTFAIATGCWQPIAIAEPGSNGCNYDPESWTSPQNTTYTFTGTVLLPNPPTLPACAVGTGWGDTINITNYPNYACIVGSHSAPPDGSGCPAINSADIKADGGACNNNFPAIPVVSGQNTGNINVATANFVVATDPENDSLYYEIDWDGNGTVDGTTGVFAAGTSVAIGHTYTVAGLYSVRARAVQNNDSLKKTLWSPIFTINIGAAYNCEASTLNPGLSIISNNSLLGVALNTGMRWYHNIFNNSNAACFRNTSGNNYFVPTKTQTERDAFMNNLPAGVTKGGF